MASTLLALVMLLLLLLLLLLLSLLLGLQKIKIQNKISYSYKLMRVIICARKLYFPMRAKRATFVATRIWHHISKNCGNRSFNRILKIRESERTSFQTYTRTVTFIRFSKKSGKLLENKIFAFSRIFWKIWLLIWESEMKSFRFHGLSQTFENLFSVLKQNLFVFSDFFKSDLVH